MTCPACCAHVVVTVDEPGWYDAGRTYGPPENCYPAEGEDPMLTEYICPECGTDWMDDDRDYDSVAKQLWAVQRAEDAAAEAAYEESLADYEEEDEL